MAVVVDVVFVADVTAVFVVVIDNAVVVVVVVVVAGKRNKSIGETGRKQTCCASKRVKQAKNRIDLFF